MIRATMRLLPLLCCLLLTVAPVRAADNWTYAASDHFEVYTTGGERRAREALVYFERVHAFFADFLKLSPRTGMRTRLIIFSGDRQFAPYRPNEVAAAYYQAGPDRDYIVMKSLDADAYPIVVHEYAHLINRHSGAVYPIWLNEGLAEFFSTLEPRGNSMSVGKVPLDRLRYLSDGVPLMDLERLFAVGHGSAEYNTRAHAGVFYSQSWALTHMLLTDNRYRPGAVQFMDLIARGSASAAAIEEAFGKPLADVSRDLSGYIRRSRYQYFLADYKSPPRGPQVPTRAVEAFEADLVTAQLLANSREREAEARAAFERLSGQKPDDLQLLESRAYFELRHGDAARARPHLARAVALGSTNASVYRDYAIIEPGNADALLAKAVALAPEDVGTRLHLAATLLSSSRAGQALATLVPVKRVPQEFAFQYFQLLANAYLRLNELEQGKTAASRAAQHAESSDQAGYATRLMKGIDDLVASRAAADAARRARAEAGATAAVAESDASVAESGATLAAAPFTPGFGGREEALSIVVTGRIRNLVCGKEPLVMEVAAGTGTIRLVIDDPLAIRVQGVEGGEVDLQCGAQDVPIRVGYQPAVDPARNTVGQVRLLDYRRQ